MADRVDRGGSDLGRPALDWEQPFAFYASLPVEQRSYQRVADQFGVSVRTVEKHGRQDRWKQRLAEIRARVAEETNSSLSQSRAEQVVRLVKLIDASLIAYADKLRRGDMRMSPADLDRLHKLWQQLSDELAEPIGSTPEVDGPAKPTRSPEHTAEVLSALSRSGALESLGLRLADAPTNRGGEQA